MIHLKSNHRGKANHGWLDTKFTFSFADYYNPEFMGFHHLRVINEDYIATQKGFGMHPHQNMEIITYIIEGQLSHQDSEGNSGVIQKGEIQKMSAGSGIMHSEVNNDKDIKTHLLQIWIKPKELNIKPDYQQKKISTDLNALNLIASPNGTETSVSINQDLNLYTSNLESGKTITHKTSSPKKYWAQIINGDLSINGIQLSSGDGLGLEDTSQLDIISATTSHFLLFEM